jgi:hypothetical protein
MARHWRWKDLIAYNKTPSSAQKEEGVLLLF